MADLAALEKQDVFVPAQPGRALLLAGGTWLGRDEPLERVGDQDLVGENEERSELLQDRALGDPLEVEDLTERACVVANPDPKPGGAADGDERPPVGRRERDRARRRLRLPVSFVSSQGRASPTPHWFGSDPPRDPKVWSDMGLSSKTL